MSNNIIPEKCEDQLSDINSQAVSNNEQFKKKKAF
jgi:hypothetical protein